MRVGHEDVAQSLTEAVARLGLTVHASLYARATNSGHGYDAAACVDAVGEPIVRPARTTFPPSRLRKDHGTSTARARYSDQPRSTAQPARAADSRAARRGAVNTDIGRRLHLSVGTVKDHVSAILAKTGAINRVQAALWAQHAGLLGPERT
ncbi:hypothetical protein GCM10022284_43880 [Streptomyces hundungensis]